MTRKNKVCLSDIDADTCTRLLAEGRFGLVTGPLVFRIQSSEKIVTDNLMLLYQHHEVIDTPDFADFHVSIERPKSIRRWLSPQVEFRLDGLAPFYSLPAAQAFALLEWGMNWCIATHCHQYILLHAAVLERNGRAVILPAPPGSGKSTLCAYLAFNGWRLLSDELALISPDSGEVYGLARPINLKNASIDIIAGELPHVPFCKPVPDTKKGTVSHMQPSANAVEDMHRPVPIGWLVKPCYVAQSQLETTPISRPEALAMVMENSFNYDILGPSAFVAITHLLENVRSFDLQYSNLAEARQWFDNLSQ